MTCPLDDNAADQSPRYPRALCPSCIADAVDLGGRQVLLGNVAMSGGFVARHRDDDSECEQVTATGQVLVRGHRCYAGEHRFGGIVIEPADA